MLAAITAYMMRTTERYYALNAVLIRTRKLA